MTTNKSKWSAIIPPNDEAIRDLVNMFGEEVIDAIDVVKYREYKEILEEVFKEFT